MIKSMTENKKSDRLNVKHLVASIDNAKSTGIQVMNSEIFGVMEKIIDAEMEAYSWSDEQMENIFKDLDPLS